MNRVSLLLLLVACWGGRPSPGTATASLEPGERDLSGAYWCSLDQSDGHEYPRYPCVIKRVGDRLVLAKLRGAQRIRGYVRLDQPDSFGFAGEMYCAWGDCSEPLRGRFRAAGSGGGWLGTLTTPPGAAGAQGGEPRVETIVLRLAPAAADAFGGAGYGGDGYGDPFAVGAYGGATYGGVDKRRPPGR